MHRHDEAGRNLWFEACFLSLLSIFSHSLIRAETEERFWHVYTSITPSLTSAHTDFSAPHLNIVLICHASFTEEKKYVYIDLKFDLDL